MTKKWRFIDTELGSAHWNMAVDEALLDRFGEDDTPILRLYRWEPSLSFGRFSKPLGSIDLALAGKSGVSCVRRITGGGILVHGGDLSYSIILPSSFAKKRGIKGSYRFLCRFLIRLYEKLGLSAGFVAESQKEEKKPSQLLRTGLFTRGSNICLAGNEEYDILIDGRKMGGNAQRHTKRAMLQHGSIPLYIDRDLLEPLFLEDSGLDGAATLHGLGVKTDFNALSLLLKEAFCETFGVTAVQEGLRSDESERANELLDRKYRDERWTVDGRE
ncbi:lopoate-protein ligase A [Hydrogenimonas sp.]|nr:lopoate-protein ligase A [Hydrogenimonas sp.]